MINVSKYVAGAVLAGASVLGVALSPGRAMADTDDVKFEELPAAVQQTVKREVKNGKITDIERDDENGKPIYEIEFDLNGKSWELDVAADGTLLQRHED
jgi:uncharacterized membrane protein YkoI